MFMKVLYSIVGFHETVEWILMFRFFSSLPVIGLKVGFVGQTYHLPNHGGLMHSNCDELNLIAVSIRKCGLSDTDRMKIFYAENTALQTVVA
jgi:hypothetical protein